jgi:hypothetical protein
MLRVSGKEIKASKAAGKQNSGDFESLVKSFGQGLESLDEVLGEDDTRGREESAHVARSQRPGSGEE